MPLISNMKKVFFFFFCLYDSCFFILQPWGVWSAEDSSAAPRGLPAVSFRRALIPGEREGGGDGGRKEGGGR